MFHQVFICDTPVEENISAAQTNDINLSVGFNDCTEGTSNVEAKCDGMELDVLPNTDLEPQVEQLPEENKFILNELLSLKPHQSDETTSNVETKCNRATLDLLPKTEVGHPQLDPLVEQLPEEIKTNPDNLRLHQSDECSITQDDSDVPIIPKKNVAKWISSLNKEQMQKVLRKLGLDTHSTRDKCRTALREYFWSTPLKMEHHTTNNVETKCDDAKIDLLPKIDTGQPQKLEQQDKQLPEETKTDPDELWSLRQHQSDERITQNDSNVPSTPQQDSNGQTTPKHCVSRWITSMNKEQIQNELRKLRLDIPRTIDMCRTVLRNYLKSKSLDNKEQNVITNVQTVIKPDEMDSDPTPTLADIIQTPKLDIKKDPLSEEDDEYYDTLQSSEGDQDDEAVVCVKNEDIQCSTSSLLNTTGGSHIPAAERESSPVEEDSRSEQKYFGLTKADVKTKRSKNQCKQSVNSNSSLTCLNSFSLKEESGHRTISKEVYPVQLLRVEVRQFKNSIKLQEKRATRNLKEKKDIGKGEVLIDDVNKLNENSDTTNKMCNKDGFFCNVTNVCTLTATEECKYFSEKYSLKKHIRQKHPTTMLILEQKEKAKKKKEIEKKNRMLNEEAFVCTKCLKPLKTKQQLYDHKRTLCYGFRRTLKYQCDLCDKFFFVKKRLVDHRNRHTNPKQYKCKSCDRCFNDLKGRNIHFKQVHGITQQSYGPNFFLCSFCGMTHVNRLHMLAHEETHRLPDGAKIPTPFICNECGKSYISRFKLVHHLRGHRQKKCPQCSEKFKYVHQVINHLRDAHNIVKEHKCNKCEKSFISSRGLRDHVSVHISVFRFSCEVCGKRFKTKHLIEQHMITHSDERLSCAECGNCFKSKANLKKHISAIHGKGRRQ